MYREFTHRIDIIVLLLESSVGRVIKVSKNKDKIII